MTTYRYTVFNSRRVDGVLQAPSLEAAMSALVVRYGCWAYVGRA